MEKWKILGINQTKDKILIKDAYREKISLYNPEDDPEGFQKLRSAYEEAIKEADKFDSDIIDKSPVDLWIEKVQENYDDFSSRINISTWRELLDDDLCFQLDYSEEVSRKLLNFLMNKFQLSNSIIKMFDECFYWTDKENELRQSYPEEFIDFIMYRINSEDNIRYELFNVEQGKEYDEFIFLYNKLLGHISNCELEEARGIIEKVDKLDIYHVDMILLSIRYYLDSNDIEKAEKLANKVLLKYDDDKAYYAVAQVEFRLGKDHIEKAKEYYEEVLRQNEKNIGAIKGIADCLSELGKYEEASEKYNEVLKVLPYSEYVRESSRNNDIKLIEKYKQILEEDETNETRFKLAWFQIKAYEYEDAMMTIDLIIPSKEEEEQYYNLLGIVNSGLRNYKEALSSFNRYKEINKDESLEYYIYLQIGKQLELLERYDEALAMYNKTIELDFNNKEVRVRKCRILSKLKKFQESIELCDEILKNDPNNANVYLWRGESLYNLGEFTDAMESLDSCINIYPYFVKSYLIEIKIFFLVDQYEYAMDLINKVEEYKIENREIEIYKARVLRKMQKYDECQALCNELLKEDVDNYYVYYELSLLAQDKNEFNEALEYINMAIKEDADNINNFYVRMNIYTNLKQYENALIDADKILSINNKDDGIYERKAIIYDEMKNYKKCIENYIKAIEINPDNSEYYNSLGVAYEKK